MKTRLITTLCVFGILLGGVTPSRAADDDTPLNTAADIVVVRPACFVATILGSVLFVISLPIAATSHSVKRTAHTLVVSPARATFTRPLGDMESLGEAPSPFKN